MSALSDSGIRSMLGKENGIGIAPFADPQLQPASYDVRLGATIRVYKPTRLIDRILSWFGIYVEILDSREDPSRFMKTITIPEKGWLLKPGRFAIGETIEELSFGDQLRSKFEGKSSLGRLGLSSHITAGFIDPGYHGNLTLELKNETGKAIRLWVGMKIGQIAYDVMMSPSTRPYGHKDLNSKYQHSVGVVASRAYLEVAH